MKKKIITPIVIIILLILLCFVGYKGYKTFQKYKQEQLLITEINEISKLDPTKSDYNTELKTTGDYAIVEKTIKTYLTDFAVSLQDLINSMQDEKLSNILSIENYKSDGPEFTATKQFLEDSQKSFSEKFENIKKMCSEDYIMDAINKTNVNEYYINLYKTLMLGENKNDGVLDSAKSDIDETNNLITSLLTSSTNVINFLVENKNNWEISGNQILFLTQESLDTYNDLLSKLPQ